jgi:hypothetical protein
MPRLILHLLDDEYQALLEVARVERREPREQVALWARQQMERTGYLSNDGRAPAGLALGAARGGEMATC